MPIPDPKETVILLAEDDVLVCNFVRIMLTLAGYAVLTAHDGAEALEVCDALGDPIHLLLTDALMPRVDGFTLAASVRHRRPEIKVIVMSGYTNEQIRSENRPDAFLRKPFIPPTLLKCVENVLASAGPVNCET